MQEPYMSAAAFDGASHEDHCLLGKKLLRSALGSALGRTVARSATSQQPPAILCGSTVRDNGMERCK